MTPPLSLEVRVAALERQVADLRAVLENGVRQKDWRRTIGMFTGDEVMKQIDQATLEIREASRRKAHRRQSKRKARKAEE
jgi:hypothetical protein